MNYPRKYLNEVIKIAESIDLKKIEEMIALIQDISKQRGRLFFIGVGGSAANCTHAVNDFRKIAKIESYTPVDNVAELSARINDDGWDTSFSNWLAISSLKAQDALFVFSVGGGNKEKNISVNIVNALDYAKKQGARIMGIVGRDGGYTAKLADVCIIIPTLSADTITPHAEAWQAVLWHLLVSDPRIMKMANKWESIDSPGVAATICC